MSNDIAVSVKNVSKRFLLPHEKKNSVKSIVTGMFGVRTSYTNQKALKDISFDIKKGEFFGIVGRNGSGKSTLLKIIAGIYQPTKGRVTVNGKLVPFIELGVGFNPELTGRENVFLNGALLGFNRKQIQKNYKSIVEFSELEKFMDQKLKNYSSGMQVRLAFACATMAEAEVLLIDEVLAVGDADFQRKCFNYFKQLKKQGTTVIFVTHDMNAVIEYCDRAILINNSHLESVGTTKNISELYTKLFNEKESNINDNSGDRWGNGNIVFKSKPSVIVDDDFIDVSTVIIANKDVENAVLGVSIENASGQVMVGTNSRILKQTHSVLEGKSYKIIWKIPNIFGTGNYTVGVALHSPDGVTVYERWNEATSFKYVYDHTSPYLISPNCKLDVVDL